MQIFSGKRSVPLSYTTGSGPQPFIYPLPGAQAPPIAAPGAGTASPALTLLTTQLNHRAGTMALWTPYAEQALDLSRATVKKERASPEPDVMDYGTMAGYCHRQAISPHDRMPVPQYYVSYHEAPCVPTAQISPESVHGAWSPSSCRKSSSPSESYDAYEAESLSDDVEYQAFERDALRAMAEKNGGSLLGNNPRMRRAVQGSAAADDSYRRQRERNNHAAKQSRDRRKLREVRLAFQVTFLKKKLADLRLRLDQRLCVRCRHQCAC